jgi:hypothetical protein
MRAVLSRRDSGESVDRVSVQSQRYTAVGKRPRGTKKEILACTMNGRRIKQLRRQRGRE